MNHFGITTNLYIVFLIKIYIKWILPIYRFLFIDHIASIKFDRSFYFYYLYIFFIKVYIKWILPIYSFFIYHIIRK